MEPNHSPEHRIRVKIGLIFFVIILYIIGVFIYSYGLKKNMDRQKKEIAHSYEVLSYSDRLIASVQEAQDMLNAYLVSPGKTFRKRYDSISSDISWQVDHIKTELPEKEQNRLLEDIDSLLREKDGIVDKLIVRFRSQNPLTELDKKISTYDGLVRDSIVVTTNKDTTTVVKRKKDFWSRLKNLFNPESQPDSTFSITRTEQETRSTSRVDTGMYADLKNITQAASKTYSTNISGIEKQVRELILAEQNISLRISQLISQFYNEAIRTSRQGVYDSEKLTVRIFTFAVFIGALSLLLILIIIFFMAGDLDKGEKARFELAKEKQLTEALMESRHKLLLSVSHDVKTPLSSMMGYMEMWEQDETSESKKRQLKSAQNSGKHILSMLANLLEFSRLERNSGTLHYSRFDLIELTEEIIAMFQPFTEGKELKIAFENLTASPFFIETDYTVFKQILVNVMSNAVKYTLRGNVCIRLQYDGQLTATVTDTGIGMEVGDLREIFKPFSRIKNPLKAEGSGFGMYVTKGLVNSLKGSIEITSEKGKGTCVVIKLPVRQLESGLPTGNKDDLPPGNKNFNKILLFEDNMALGTMIREFLTKKGYKVKLCNNPQDINGFLRHISLFDIVFTDMQMISVTGTDILREIRKINQVIPVWLMTAYDDYTTEKAVSEGFSGFVKKPVQMGRFVEILSGNGPEKSGRSSLTDEFPLLLTLFGDDTDTIKDILSGFVQSSRKDTETLTECIERHDFKGAQQVCHKIHPFFSQIGAKHLCGALCKMDTLWGQEETVYPDWEEELSEAVRQIKEFSNGIAKEYL